MKKRQPNYIHGLVKLDAPYSKHNISKALWRDKWTCQFCGVKDVPIDVHHKDGKGKHTPPGEINNVLENLVTLCKRCHLYLHYPLSEKYQDVITRRNAGETLQTIAASYGVSRQRIHQILVRVSKRHKHYTETCEV